MTILDKYRANVVMDINLTKGSLNDQSGNGNNATPTGFNTWGVWRRQRALGFGTGKYLTVTDNAALRSADYTLIAVGDYRTAVSNARLFSKRGATVNYELYISATGTQLGIYNGTTSSLLTTTIKDNRFIACRTANRQAPTFFVDGVNKGQGSAPLTANTTDTPSLILGNMADGVSGPISSLNSRFIMLNTAAITDAEMAQLYEELMNEGGGLKSPSRGFVAEQQPLDSDCILAYDMETRTPDGKIADLSGTGRHGTLVAPIAPLNNGTILPALDCNNDNRTVSFTPISPGTVYTLETVVQFSKYDVVLMGQNTSNYLIYLSNTAVFTNVGVYTNWSVPALNLKMFHHIVLVRDGIHNTLYINGVSYGTADLVSNTPSANLDSLFLQGYAPNGKIGSVRLFSTAKDSNWVADKYKKFASNLNFREDLKSAPVTLRDLSASSDPSIPNTDFAITAGNWKVIEDSDGKRWIRGVDAGVIYTPNKKAYGTFVVDMIIGSVTNIPYILPFATVKGVHNAAGQQSYILYVHISGQVVFARAATGGLTTLISSPNGYCSSNTPYRFCISRDYIGKFTIYIKGGVYAAWTKVEASVGTNPVVDNLFTASNYLVLSTQTLNNTDRFSNVIVLEGVIDPTVNPNLIPN